MERLEQKHLTGYKDLGEDVVYQMTKTEAEALKMALELASFSGNTNTNLQLRDTWIEEWDQLWSIFDKSGIDSVLLGFEQRSRNGF
jgi:hypothetical protein